MTVDAAFGFRPVRTVSGLPYNGAVRELVVPATYGTALYVGSPVLETGDSDADGRPEVNAAAIGASGPVSWVITGFAPLPSSLDTKYWVASTATDRICYGVNVRDMIFEIQEDSDGGALTTASMGLNASWVGTGGNTTTGISTIELDSDTAATTNTLQLRIEGFRRAPDNTLGDNNAIWEVRFLYPQVDAILGLG